MILHLNMILHLYIIFLNFCLTWTLFMFLEGNSNCIPKKKVIMTCELRSNKKCAWLFFEIWLNARSSPYLVQISSDNPLSGLFFISSYTIWSLVNCKQSRWLSIRSLEMHTVLAISNTFKFLSPITSSWILLMVYKVVAWTKCPKRSASLMLIHSLFWNHLYFNRKRRFTIFIKLLWVPFL